MILITSLLVIICPIIGFVLAIFLYFTDKKHTVFLSIILGLIFGIISYYIIPATTYDLYKLREPYFAFKNNYCAWSYFFQYITTTKFEKIPMLYTFLISKIGNIDLLQFFIVTTGYSLLFYIMADYRKIKNIKNVYFIPIVINIIFGYYVFHAMTGLYFYFSMILFSFAFYLEYTKKKSKLITYPIYILSLGMHTTTFFAIAILCIFKLFKEQINIKKIVLTLVLVVFSYQLLSIICTKLNIPLISSIMNIYTAYLKNNDKTSKIYDGALFILEFLKLTLCILFLYKNRKNESDKKNNSFLVLMIVCTVFMMSQSIVMIRFIMLIQFVAIVPMFDVFDNKNKNNIYIYMLMLLFSLYYIIYFFHTLSWMNLGNLFSEKIFNNLINIFKK